MLVFLSGPSSVGKSTILKKLAGKQSLPFKIHVLEGDAEAMTFLKMVSAEIGEGKRPPMDMPSFKVLIDQMYHDKVVPIMKRAALDDNTLLVVDDVLRNIPGYKLTVPYFVVLIGAPLDRILRNLKARSKTDTRSAAAVLDEISASFAPSHNHLRHCESMLVFKKNHLESFRALYDEHPYSVLGKRLPTTIRRFRDKFFPHGEDNVCVVPTPSVRVDAFFIHTNTSRVIDQLVAFFQNHLGRY